jgi:hypothetical protein
MFEEYSYQRFTHASHEQMPTLLLQLRKRIFDRVTRTVASHVMSEEAIVAFHNEVETICQELAHQGHVLGQLDFDRDIRLEHNHQYWGTNYRDCAPNGLEIEFRPTRIRILWVVGLLDDARDGL